MNLLLVFSLIGKLLLVESALMAPSLVIALIDRTPDASAIGITMAIAAAAGVALSLIRPKDDRLRPREGFSVVAMAWMIFSLLGGVTAMLTMIGLKQLRRLSIYGVSIGGAAAHNVGQIAAAIITLGDTAVVGYLPVLLGVSLITGSITGLVAALLFRAMKNVHLSH